MKETSYNKKGTFSWLTWMSTQKFCARHL